MYKGKEKKVGKRKSLGSSINLKPSLLSEADQWLRTVNKLRGADGVCKKGIYKFKTFEEADKWMERMILSSIQEYQR